MRRPESSHIHLVGAGGSGLSSLAGYLTGRGHRVTGSDRAGGALLDGLRERGVELAPIDRLPGAAPDVVVHTPAVDQTHPELAWAAQRDIECLSYPAFLGREAARKRTVAVCGTHGKTTTSGWVAHVLETAGRRPSVVIGGAPTNRLLGGWAGEGDEFVVEACEYQHSFLSYRADVVAVTNVEADHLDYFEDEAAVRAAFEEFLSRAAPGATVVLHEQAAAALDLGRLAARCAIVGEGRGVTDLLQRHRGAAPATLHVEGRRPVALAPSLPGEHNLANAAVVASLCLRLGVSEEAVEEGVSSFAGMRRRLERLGLRHGATWFSDYAHHPTEVAAVASALASHGSRRIAVFQPHQAVRTEQFLHEFAQALTGFDVVVFPGIFTVREDLARVSDVTERFVAAVRAAGVDLHPVSGLSEVDEVLARVSEDGDVVVLMGAGDIDSLAEPLRHTRVETARV